MTAGVPLLVCAPMRSIDCCVIALYIRPGALNFANNFKMHAQDWFLVLIAIFVPPIPVAVKRGLSMDLFINICLCLLGFIPGLIHACYIISLFPYKETYAALGGDGHNNRSDYGSVST